MNDSSLGRWLNSPGRRRDVQARILSRRLAAFQEGCIIFGVRAVLQRVTEASVDVAGDRVSAIGRGLLVLVGVGRGDGAADIEWLADKIVQIRVFSDEAGQMNRSVQDVGGELL